MFYWALSARLGQNFTQIQGISSWWWQNRFKESVSQQKTNTALVPSFQGRESWTLPVECTQWMVLLGSLGQDGVGAEQTLRTVFVLPVTRWVVLGPVCILCLNSLLQRGTYKTAPLKYLSGQMSSGQVVSTEASETGTQSQLPPPVQASFLRHSPCKGCKFLEGQGEALKMSSRASRLHSFHQDVPPRDSRLACLLTSLGSDILLTPEGPITSYYIRLFVYVCWGFLVLIYALFDTLYEIWGSGGWGCVWLVCFHFPVCWGVSNPQQGMRNLRQQGVNKIISILTLWQNLGPSCAVTQL